MADESKGFWICLQCDRCYWRAQWGKLISRASIQKDFGVPSSRSNPGNVSAFPNNDFDHVLLMVSSLLDDLFSHVIIDNDLTGHTCSHGGGRIAGPLSAREDRRVL